MQTTSINVHDLTPQQQNDLQLIAELIREHGTETLERIAGYVTSNRAA
jgi:ribosomal protein S17E